MSALTPEEFAVAAWLLTLPGSYDPEGGHSNTDELMERTLAALGYDNGIDLIQASDRWYA